MKSHEISFCSNFDFNGLISSPFCTCHTSWHAKSCDLIGPSLFSKGDNYFCKIWITSSQTVSERDSRGSSDYRKSVQNPPVVEFYRISFVSNNVFNYHLKMLHNSHFQQRHNSMSNLKWLVNEFRDILVWLILCVDRVILGKPGHLTITVVGHYLEQWLVLLIQVLIRLTVTREFILGDKCICNTCIFIWQWDGADSWKPSSGKTKIIVFSLQWRHIEHDGVSNQQRRGCLLNRLFWRRSSKLHGPGLSEGKSTGHRWIPLTKGQ